MLEWASAGGVCRKAASFDLCLSVGVSRFSGRLSIPGVERTVCARPLPHWGRFRFLCASSETLFSGEKGRMANTASAIGRQPIATSSRTEPKNENHAYELIFIF